MIFPEIANRIKGAIGRWNTGPTTLGLSERKDYGQGFSPIDVGWYVHNGYRNIAAALSGGSPAWSGEMVSLQTAMNHSVVWACNRIISESVAFIPLNILQESNGARRIATEHPLFSVLRYEPNPEMTAMSFRETRTSHCLLQGGGYAQIFRRSGTGVAREMYPLSPEQVRTDREKSALQRLVYVVKDGNSQERTYTVASGKPHDILHIKGIGYDGITGYSVIQMARQSIGTALATERNIGRFMAAGGRVPYHLEMASRFAKPEDFDRFRSDWEGTYSQPHKVPILEQGITYHQDGINAKDSQMLEMRLFSIHEICRWFAVSPHLVGDLSRATFSNIEQLALEFVKMTLTTWLTKWEMDLRRCLLTDKEKAAGYYFKHNVSALLRGDFASRMAGYNTMLQNGIATINEVRELEDWNPLETPGCDDPHIQLNMQALPGGTPLDSQLSQADEASGSTTAGREVPETKSIPQPSINGFAVAGGLKGRLHE